METVHRRAPKKGRRPDVTHIDYWVPVAIPLLLALLLPLLRLPGGSVSDRVARRQSQTIESALDAQEMRRNVYDDVRATQRGLDMHRSMVNNRSAEEDDPPEIQQYIDAELKSLNSRIAQELSGPEDQARDDYAQYDKATRSIRVDTLDITAIAKKRVREASDEQAERNDEAWRIVRDFFEEFSASAALAIISVDVWALTVIMTGKREDPPYGYPLIGLFAHVCLLTLCEGLLALDTGLTVWAALGVAILGIGIGLWVRDCIARAHDVAPAGDP